MKKKVISLFVTGMLAVSMIAGCGSDNTADTSTSADTTSDASTDAAADTTAEEAPAATTDFDASEYVNVLSREDGSGTRGAFIELFGIEEKDADGNKVDNTTEEAIITNSTSVMLTSVASDEYAIGYVSLGSLDDTVKAVSIDGAEATAENIKSGEYKVSRPFNIAVKKDMKNEVAKDFINYVMSEEGQKIVSDNGYIPVDGAKPYSGKEVSGKVVVGGSSSVSPVMEKLIEAYKKVNTGAEIELQTTDSTTGMTSAIDGTYDIGMASRELKDDEASELEATVIATDGIAVIVNKANTADELSADQVKSIYVGDVTTWDEVSK